MPGARIHANRLAIGSFLGLFLLLAVQTSLVLREQIFSPIDELAHTDYVRAIAEEGRLPIYGESHIDPALLAVYYHTYPRVELTTAQVRDLPPSLGLNYEALQFPVFYGLAAPVYRLVDADLRVAIYGVRLVNVALSAVLLLMVVALLRRVHSLRSGPAVAVALALLLIPGVSLRDSQVTNQVLAAVLVTVLIYLLVQREAPSRRQTFVEGALLATATLTKLTALAAVFAVVFAWATRPGGLRPRLTPGAAGFILPFLPWLAWALPVYGHPLPWVARHPQFWDRATFLPPDSVTLWASFLRQLVLYFWVPWEWRAPSGLWHWLVLPAIVAGSGVLLAGVLWGGVRALRRPISDRATPIALLALAGLAVGYLVLAIGLKRVFVTDLRELYIFLGALAILLGGVAARLGPRVGGVLFSGVIGVWLLIDFSLYVVGTCIRCYP
jgi:hypothetical protein